jgi:signal transduction histidine kinase
LFYSVSLRHRIYLLLSALVAITLVGGLIMVWYTYRMQSLLTNIVDKEFSAFRVSMALETALVNQKGFVSYYLLEGDPEWLKDLGKYRQMFQDRLEDARAMAETDTERAAIARIEDRYQSYVTDKDRVIAHYKSGEREKGAKLHREVRDRFFRVLDEVDAYNTIYTQRVRQVRDQSLSQSKDLRVVAGTAIGLVLVLGLLLAMVLIRQVLGPVRRLALEADRSTHAGIPGPDNEVKALSRSVRDLMAEYNHTHVELERSRESLLQAEKMALVGKLAAGTAHSIRNPLTSVKMRLFSLSRSLQLSPTQKDDFDVISDEIRHIDTIVENFLEFARPPKLAMQPVSPSDVVDTTIRLLKHRLESYNVEVTVHRKRPLPVIQADPEQLKEVFVNLMVNACEAMDGGGTVTIDEDIETGTLGRKIVLRFTDNGPGISRAVRPKVLEPFFTTKDEGTGLGLSIAARIVEQHGGELGLTSVEGEGATFTVSLPEREARL